MALSENGKVVFDYVKEHGKENITAQDIANGTGIPSRSVNALITSAFCRKGLMERVLAEIELEDGSHKSTKFIRLTPEGEKFDPNVVEGEEQ